MNLALFLRNVLPVRLDRPDQRVIVAVIGPREHAHEINRGVLQVTREVPRRNLVGEVLSCFLAQDCEGGAPTENESTPRFYVKFVLDGEVLAHGIDCTLSG